MPDPDTPAAPAAPTPSADPAPPAPAEPRTYSQEEFDRVLGRVRAEERQKFADYDDLKQKASKFEEIETANQSDLERVSGELDTTKTELGGTKAENLRLRVALEKKVPADLIDRLRGGTKEELEADADKLLELVKPADPGPGLDGGTRKPAPPSGDNVSPGLPRLASAYAQNAQSK